MSYFQGWLQDLLHLRKRAQLPEQVDVVRVVGAEFRAGGRRKALSVSARPPDELLVAAHEFDSLSGEGEDRLEPRGHEPSAGSKSGEFDLQFDVTRTGLVSGTPAYMAPEQHRGEPGGAAADQFAFCVTLWEALYRRRPFAGRNYFELSEAILTGTRTEIPRGSHVPGWLQRLLERGMAVDPRARHPSVQLLLASIVFTFRVMHGPA